MVRRTLWALTILALLLSSVALIAQETTTRGSVSGVVQDSTGAVVPGAKVTLTGPTGSVNVNTEADGRFRFPQLIPGTYTLKVEKEGFRIAVLKAVQVETNKTSSIAMTLVPGIATETVEVSATAVTIDTKSTTVGANLSDNFYQSIPMARGVAGLFYTAPGVADGGGTGKVNPSISGASGLENLYVADGVNITDPAFGGLGVYSQRYGSTLSTGINLAFVKEVNVKTAGFEPQYGQADGGIVQIVTKSGGTTYHGAIAAYFAPDSTAATPRQSDDVRAIHYGYIYMPSTYEISGELGGYVPGLKNHLYFFGSIDPTWLQQHVQAADFSPLNANGVYTRFFRTINYAGKLTFRINDRHQVESSAFGDPAKTNTTIRTFRAVNTLGFSNIDYGTRNWVVRYNGTLSPTWLVNASFNWSYGKFLENPAFDAFQVTQRGFSSLPTAVLSGFGFLQNHTSDNYNLGFDTSKVFHLGGEHTFSVGYQYGRPTYRAARFYYGPALSSPNGSEFGYAVPAANMAGQDMNALFYNCSASDPTCPVGKTTNASFTLQPAPATCTSCPTMNDGGVQVPVRLNQTRGVFSPTSTPTTGRYHAAYVNDSWAITNRINLSMGLRWEQWRMTGNSGSTYAMTGNWAPRVGVSVDPWGDRKTKIYANFGRYNYQTPLDAAIRNLSAESDLQRLYYAPDFDPVTRQVIINADGSVGVTPDAAHTLNGTAAGLIDSTPVVSISSPEGFVFAPGTKMQYEDEFVVGAEHEFAGGFVLSGRFIYRRVGRAMEDVAGVSPEGYLFGLQQNYLIANPNRTLDLFPNENSQSFIVNPGAVDTATITNYPTGCSATTTYYPIIDANGYVTGPPNTAVCFLPDSLGLLGGELKQPGNIPQPDGKPDGYPDVVRNYKAVEIELNKSFAHNWMMRANWRIASLKGNWEGAYRNDNGQTDPNISSLYDFTEGIVGLLGDQFGVGPLNTDRRHVVNGFLSYTVPNGPVKGLTLGTGIRFQSGTPINELAAHPAYGNGGEVPIGGRGKLGRTPISGNVDLHVDMPFRVTERQRLHFIADLFNLVNSRRVLNVDQYRDLDFDAPNSNPDFRNVAPTSLTVPPYQDPFSARFSVRWEF